MTGVDSPPTDTGIRVLRNEDSSAIGTSTSTDGPWTALIGGTTPSDVTAWTKYVLV